MTIAGDCFGEIVGRLSSNPALDKPAVLPFNVESLKENFNAQLDLLLKQRATEDELSTLKEILSIDKYEVFEDRIDTLFVNFFNDNVGLIGFGALKGNFKILSLSYIEPKTRDDLTILKFAFGAFMKIFLPKLDPDEAADALKKNYFFTAGALVVETFTSHDLNMINVFIDEGELN